MASSFHPYPDGTQIPHLPKAPALPDLPASWDLNENVNFSVPIRITLAGTHIDVDTGSFYTEYYVGVHGAGTIKARYDGTLPFPLHKQLLDHINAGIRKTYV